MHTKREDAKLILLEEARAGVHGTYEPVKGYGTCTIEMYDRGIEKYYGRLAQGGWVIDKRPICEPASFVGMVFSAPMPDPKLKANEQDPCPEISDMLAHGLQGAFAAIAFRHKANPKGMNLTGVSVEEYVSYWRGNGARIGRRMGDEVVFMDGSREPVVPEPVHAR